jgi:DNA-binding IclR family transcriptional regulator
LKDEIPSRKTRLIVAQLLHSVLRLAHSAYAELPFMQAVEVTMIVTAIFSAESEGKPFSASGLSEHLGMPRPTLSRRLSFLQSKEIVRRDAQGLRVNPQLFTTPSRDKNIRQLRKMIIDAGATLVQLGHE